MITALFQHQQESFDFGKLLYIVALMYLIAFAVQIILDRSEE